MSKKLIPAVGFTNDDNKEDSKQASIPASTSASDNTSTQEVLPDKKQDSVKDSENSFLLTKQKRIKQEQLSVRINELVWEWLDKTYRASGRGKNELVERALIRLLPEKLMPKELRSILPADYFDKL